MNSTLRKVVNYVFFFGLAILLLYFAFRKVELSTIVEGFKKANYFWVVLSMVVAIIANVFRALRWRLLMEPLGKTPSVGNVFHAVMIGYLANFAFPRIGEVTRCGTLRKTDKLSFESLIGTVLVERASDMALLLMSVILVFLLKIDFFGAFLIDKIFKPLFFKASGFSYTSLVLIASLLLSAYLLLYMVKRNVFGRKIKIRVKSMYYGIIDGLKSIGRMRQRGRFIAYSFVVWGCYYLMTWTLVYATDATSHLTAMDSLFVMVIGSFGMVVPVQGGFGAFHIITAMGLSLFGISNADGLVFATIAHESQALLLIVMGTISLAILFLRKKHAPGV